MKILAILTFENSLIIAYGLIGFVALMAYVPQLHKLFRSKNAVTDISLHTWSIWCLDAAISLLYAIFILQDYLTIFIFAIDFMGAASILGLVTRNQLQNGRYSIRSARIAAICMRFEKAAMRSKSGS